jgi:NDP-hexose-3-ketoreductase
MGATTQSSPKKGDHTKLNLAIWGLGPHAFKNILPAFKSCPDVRLAGVYSRNPASVKKACEENGCRFWNEEKAFLLDEDVDAIYLATPVGLHYEHGLAVLDSGKHLLCEKSLTHSRQTAKALTDRARELNLLLCETFMYQYHPQFEAIARRLREHPRRILSLTSSLMIPQPERPGYRFDASLGGGALLDLGCYPISMALALGAEAEMPSVQYAYLENSKQVGVDIFGTALLRSQIATHAFLSWGYGFAYKNNLSLLTETETIDVDFAFSKRPELRASIRVQDLSGRAEVVEIEPANGFVRMLSHANFARFNRSMRENLLSQAKRQSELLDLIRQWSFRANNLG